MSKRRASKEKRSAMHGAKQVGVPQGWGLSGIALGIFAGMLQLMMLLSEACGKICRSMAYTVLAKAPTSPEKLVSTYP